MLSRRLTSEELSKLRELYEERAAIKEFLGNITREQAEQEAWTEIYGKKPEQLKL